MQKKTVLFIIDSLAGIGGAELMMVAPLKELSSTWRIIVVTLEPVNVFEDGYIGDEQYCLHLTSKLQVFKATKKLKEVISKENVTFVHAFLYWSVVVARLACGKRTPLVFSLATMMTEHIYTHKWYSGYAKLIDKLTYKKRQSVISPTKEVLTDFDSAIGVKGASYVIPNFVLDEFFANTSSYKIFGDRLRIVAVGNVKQVKNYQVVLDALQLSKHLSVTIDIYGFGDLTEVQKQQVAGQNLPVTLMGSGNDIYKVLPKYDVFIMSSFLEGFGISAAEAMAMGLPLILSDIKTLHEVSQENAFFFDPYDAATLAKVFSSVFANKEQLMQLSEKGKIIAKSRYTKQQYIRDLLKVYDDLLNK